MRYRTIALAAGLSLASVTAWAQFSPAFTTTAVTVTNSSAQAVAGHKRQYLGIFNDSASATIACALGAAATVNAAGSITIAPLGAFIFDGQKVPADAVNCISTAATSAATILE